MYLTFYKPTPFKYHSLNIYTYNCHKIEINVYFNFKVMSNFILQ